MNYRKELEKAAKEARETIQDALVKKRTGSALQRLHAAAKEIEMLLARFAKAIRSFMPLAVQEGYIDALKDQSDNVDELIGMLQLDDQLEYLAFNAANASEEYVRDAMVRVREATREVRYEGVIRGWLHDGLSPQQAVERLTESLRGEGNALGGITYRDGRVVPYDTYAAMAVRTAVNQAANMAAIGVSLSEWGEGVVRMSKHYPTCAVCAPLQDRYYRTMDFTREDERSRLPHISAAYRLWPEFDNVHPNCRHISVSINWSMLPKEERARALADADKPTGTDTRSVDEIKAYRADQQKKAQMNSDRKQYVRWRQVLGGSAPRSFAAFRRMKASGSDTWALMNKKYNLYVRGMKDGVLPNALLAVTTEEKLRGYLLSSEHPAGKHKAHVIRSVLGYAEVSWNVFSDKLYWEVQKSPVNEAKSFTYNKDNVTISATKFTVPIIMSGEKGRMLEMLTVWQIDEGSGVPRFITATFPKKGGS
ncbi:phage minor capsid protein [Eubacteriales bacterium OttesenSCG-928-K08]|nr:phage minor capsid protein [Eubacteriales bacterium OttesenSCG-928-K08]